MHIFCLEELIEFNLFGFFFRTKNLLKKPLTRPQAGENNRNIDIRLLAAQDSHFPGVVVAEGMVRISGMSESAVIMKSAGRLPPTAHFRL